MITFKIDELSPCLIDTQTGDIIETEVVQIKRKTFLSKFNKRTGWYVNWGKFPEGTEVYALVIKGTVDIQGMVAIDYDHDAKAVHVQWGCTAPQNNVWEYGSQKYKGVGGHLLAVASELSMRVGFEGFIYGEAMDKELYDYYIDEFGALPLPPTYHPYRFMIPDNESKKLREVYDYDWTEEII